MSINSNYSNIARAVTHLKNPNLQTGTLLIELPADVGRAYSGYKRGGFIEASEKFRKEVMSAGVWLFGIPAFNAIGNWACEKLLKIPMDIDYSNSKRGRDAIRDSIEYLTDQTKTKGKDVSELKKYIGKVDVKNIESQIKKIKGAKQFVSIGALILNCLLMGVVLPKINQKITENKLKKENIHEHKPQFESMDEFKARTKKEKESTQPSFKGLSINPAQIADYITYGVNNENRFRLISTDVPMILGRCATARNKFEALEIAFIDSASIYFYNFCLQHVEKLFKKATSTPEINAKIGEYISNLDNKTLENALNSLSQDGTKQSIAQLFNNQIQTDIYNEATHGKYNKINRFVKDDDLKEIDSQVETFLKYIKSKNLLKDGNLDTDALKKLVKQMNIKSFGFYGIGTIASIFGLGILVPKIGYFITKQITGKDGFIGIDGINSKKC